MNPLRTCVLLVPFLAACGGEGRPDAAARRAPAPPPPSVALAAEPPLYDAEGRLLPSDVRVAGLALPRGMEPLREDRAEHVYLTEVPTAKVLAYFGPRLFTVQIDRVGNGAVYRRAKPLDARGAEIFLDVSVLPAGGGKTRVHVHELPVAPARPEGEVAGAETRREAYRGLD